MATRGQVKWFDPKKGYGFIVGPSGQDVFVHYSQIQGEGFRSLKDGEPVDYELIQGEKGWQAKGVQRVNPPPARSEGGTQGYTGARKAAPAAAPAPTALQTDPAASGGQDPPPSV